TWSSVANTAQSLTRVFLLLYRISEKVEHGHRLRQRGHYGTDHLFDDDGWLTDQAPIATQALFIALAVDLDPARARGERQHAGQRQGAVTRRLTLRRIVETRQRLALQPGLGCVLYLARQGF